LLSDEECFPLDQRLRVDTDGILSLRNAATFLSQANPHGSHISPFPVSSSLLGEYPSIPGRNRLEDSIAPRNISLAPTHSPIHHPRPSLALLASLMFLSIIALYRNLITTLAIGAVVELSCQDDVLALQLLYSSCALSRVVKTLARELGLSERPPAPTTKSQPSGHRTSLLVAASVPRVW
jgi:hypothetical protein